MFRALAALALTLILAGCSAAAAPSAPAASKAGPSASESAAAKPASQSAAAKPASQKPAAKPASQKPAAKPADAAQTRLVVAYGQPNIHNSILWIAVEKGLFKKYGVDAEMTQVTGPAITQGLIAGQLELIFSSAASPFIAHLEGGDTLLVGSNVNKPPTDLVVNPKKIAKPEDLKSKTGGVQQAGDLSDVATRVALDNLKISLSDVKILTGFRNDADRVTGILAGAIDFAPIDVGLRQRYAKEGLTKIVSLLDLDTSFMYGGIFTSKKIEAAKPAAIEGAMKAISEAVYLFKTQPDTIVPIAAKYMKLDPAEVKVHYEEINPVINKTPAFTRDGVMATLKDLELATPKAKGANPDEFYTTKYIDALDKSGFNKQLWGDKT